ncbi:MAG: PAS domain-containing protein, partial [candidate division NC10 bacterium]|nr:PAS domain-containing protein [candidate division NC10 bacterium]
MPTDRPRLSYASLPVMIRTAGSEGACDFFNQRWLEFTGRGLEEEVGFGWADRLHPDDRERVLSRYREALAAHHPFEMEYRLLRHDGEY